jgi:hypothetical protein
VKRRVHQQGHTHELYVVQWSSSCGDIERGGIAFEFGDCHGQFCRPSPSPFAAACAISGPWVVSLDELKRIVEEAELAHRELAALHAAAAEHGELDQTDTLALRNTIAALGRKPPKDGDK